MGKPVTTLFDGLFQKRHEIKVTRTQYGLTVGINATAGELKKALEKIPNEAKIIDYEDVNEGLSIHRKIDNGTVYIFEVEKTDE